MPDRTMTRHHGNRPATGLGALLASGATGLIAASVALLPGCGRGEASAQQPPTVARVNVQLAPAQETTFRRTIIVQGNVSAKSYALVSPRLGGVLDAVDVDEGDTVVADETVLFQTDSIKLAEAVEARRDDVAVAAASLREQQAGLAEEQAEHERILYDLTRYLEMHERGATTEREMAFAVAEKKKSEAKVQHAEALVALAEAQLGQARSYLAMAEKDLADSRVTAPIDGRVSARYKEPGEMGTPGQPVLRIDDPVHIEISVFLPAEAYADVLPDRTPAHIIVNGADLGQLPIIYKSPTIDLTTRTFEAHCELRNPPPNIAPGAMARVEVILDELGGLGVPSPAVQRRAGGYAVFTVENDAARLVPVVIGLETGGMTQILSGELTPGTPVITVGGYFLDAGDPVHVVEEDA